MEETVNAGPLGFYREFSQSLTKTLSFLFNLAWLSRVRLPAYLCFLFLASDVRLSVEIRVGEHVAPDLDDLDFFDIEEDLDLD